jgi:hypothetical protein
MCQEVKVDLTCVVQALSATHCARNDAEAGNMRSERDEPNVRL